MPAGSGWKERSPVVGSNSKAMLVSKRPWTVSFVPFS